MPSKAEAKTAVLSLVRNYLTNAPSFQKQSEEDTRVKFIDRMFEALGWDVFGDKIPDEVEREQSIKVKETGKKKADYTFKIKGITRLVVEAKAIGEDLDNDTFVTQAVTYAFNRACSWAILTNFRTIRLFFVTAKGGTPFYRIELSDEDDFDTNFETLWYLSKESVLIDSLGTEAKRRDISIQKIDIDLQLFKDLTRWRELLSADIRKRYSNAYQADVIDEAVQRIIDRLIFIRKTEDAKLEEPYLEQIIRRQNENTYDQVKKVFLDYRNKYDSNLFGETAKQDHISDTIDLTNEVIEKVIRGTYWPSDGRLQYDFANIPSDVLGNIYEQYLAYVLSQVKKKVRLEGGIAHRKQQGIYYTPTYIVEFIVKNTVGETLKDTKQPENLRILDPACGSGSFLIKAYDTLNQFFLRHDKNYEQTKLDFGTNIPFTRKVEILRDNLYAVDLDVKAVEIAQLNLLMKIAERGHRLPVLQKNIKYGNSIVDDDQLEPEKAFDWKTGFPEIMSQNKFDIVIGNPPYVQLSMEEESDDRLKEYLIQKFGSSMGRLNTFGFFVKLGIDLLKEGGRLGFILPNTILTQEYYRELREMILESCVIEKIANFADLPFKDAIVENVILILRKESSKTKRLSSRVHVYSANHTLDFVEQRTIPAKEFLEAHEKSFNIFMDRTAQSLKARIEANTTPLVTFLDVNQAIALKHDRAKYLSRSKDSKQYKPLLDGRNINRYSLKWDDVYLRYDINAIHSSKREEIFLTPEKLLFRRVGERLTAAYDDEQFYALNTIVVMNKKPETKLDLKYFLALFNSKLLNYYYQNFLKSTKKVFSEIQARQVEQLPIKVANAPIQAELVQLATRLILLNKKLSKLGQSSTSEKDKILDEIDRTEKRTDSAVYSLYGLGDKEIEVIEVSQPTTNSYPDR